MQKRRVEVFRSDCYLCDDAVKLVKEIACENCEVTIYDLAKEGQDKAREYDISAVPSIVVDGNIVDCCTHGKVNKEALVAAGIGQ